MVASTISCSVHDIVLILFCVSVPVLSEQTQSAPPIVSQAYNCLTKFLSSNILSAENAKERVTANGSPSGIAITIIAIAIIKYSRMSSRL